MYVFISSINSNLSREEWFETYWKYSFRVWWGLERSTQYFLKKTLLCSVLRGEGNQSSVSCIFLPFRFAKLQQLKLKTCKLRGTQNIQSFHRQLWSRGFWIHCFHGQTECFGIVRESQNQVTWVFVFHFLAHFSDIFIEEPRKWSKNWRGF